MFNPRIFPRTRTSLIHALGGRADSTAWREFFHHYSPAVYRVATLRGLQPSDAEDIVQEVMLAIARQISTFDYCRDRGRFRDWVRRITENKIVDLRRRKATRESITKPFVAEPEDDRETIDKYWRDQWLLQDLEFCLTQITSRVSEKRITAFRLYAMEGVSAADTAAQLGLKIGYVYAIRNQILNLIKEEMAKLENAEGNNT